MRIRLVALAVLGIALLGPAGSAQAALTVANTNDSGPGSLRQAVAEAGPGETINLPAGTYTLTSGELVISKTVTISGHAAADTTIRAGGPFAVVQITGPLDATISGVTIRDGNPTGVVVLGGGINSINEANLTLRGVAVTNNIANTNGGPGAGGGVALGGGIYSEGALTLSESSVTDNTASSVGGTGKGGGVPLGGGIFASGALTIVNSTVSRNTAAAMGGAGPANASQSGGVALGGGLYTASESPSSLIGVTFNDNVADVSGGPGGGGGVVLGGGVFASAGPASISFANATVASNVARAQGAGGGGIALGGGMHASASEPGSITLLGVTAGSNRIEAPAAPPNGGGNLFTEDNVNLGNTIVAGGSGPAGTENCGGTPGTSLGFNIDSLDQCGFHYIGDQVNTNPLLGPLQSNGGLTQTMIPALGSPAIDQGRALGLTTDQRGVLRPIDLPMIPNSPAAGADGSDIGAVEFQPSNALVLGKLTKNKKKGTATLAVSLPAPSVGVLTLGGKGLKTQTATISGETEVKLQVLPASKAVKKALRKKGKRKVQIEATYTPTGNSAATQTRKATLVKKKKKKRRKPAKR
jgi:hypothetical protein